MTHCERHKFTAVAEALLDKARLMVKADDTEAVADPGFVIGGARAQSTRENFVTTPPNA